MHIGIYLGRWSLHQLGGMGVYLRNLLAGVRELDSPDHRLSLLVDDVNLDAANQVAPALPVITLHRPDFDDIPPGERRRIIQVRRLSYKNIDDADAKRHVPWSTAAESYLWGLDDAVTRSGIDLLYFTIPPYLKCPRVPYLLTLHDLKHLHRPQDHDAADLARRRRWTRVAHSASLVYASFDHIRRDLLHRLGLPSAKTAVLPLACPDEFRLPPSPAHPPSDLDLPEKFALMPAQFWPHKNHQRVVQAIAYLRHQRNLNIPVICTGQNTGQCASCAHRVAYLAKQLGVADLVRQIGFVSNDTLTALYAGARFILVATLYDPGSFPAMEALAMGKPLAASRVTTIPETVGDAAALFDPHRVEDIANVLARLWTDDELCQRLARRGPDQVANRTWTDVARDWLQLCERAAHHRTPQEVFS
ncbi:MAG: glycosyltransferase family 4 protein [Phycisphaerae bacterium]